MGVLISVRLADIVRQQMMKRKEVIKNGQINGHVFCTFFLCLLYRLIQVLQQSICHLEENKDENKEEEGGGSAGSTEEDKETT